MYCSQRHVPASGFCNVVTTGASSAPFRSRGGSNGGMTSAVKIVPGQRLLALANIHEDQRLPIMISNSI